ncbi:MAG TPA: LptF/LptG family permease [Vicinamibacterales bacterium]|nr:LptF/LptG family permease [Vicinamibacterales bacterium]
MSRPGTRLRALSARVCSERLMRRLIDPALADLQAEHEEAVRSRRLWKSRWVLLSGYVAWIRVMALCGPLALRQDLSGWTVDDGRALSRTAWLSLAVTVAATVLLLRMQWTSWVPTHANTMTLVRYLIPAMLPLSVPVGLTLGTTLSLSGRAVSRRLVIALLMIGLGLSVPSFVMVDRIVPVTNQAYREAWFGSSGVQRGSRELTLAELRARIDSYPRMVLDTAEAARRMRVERRDYYGRYAAIGIPFVFTLFALAIVGCRRFGRFGSGCAGFLGLVVWYLLEGTLPHVPRDGFMPPLLTAWLPHLAIIATSVALLRSRTVRLPPSPITRLRRPRKPDTIYI